MGTGRIAKARATLERLDQQAVTLDRLDTLMDRCVRLSERGITWEQIVTRRDQINAVADDGVYHDVNDALQTLYVEAFGPTTDEEGR
jgi:hypothetical protein